MFPAILLVSAVLALQLLLSLKVKKRFIHFLPFLLFFLTGGVLILLAVVIQGWSALVYLALAIYAGIAAGAAFFGLLVGVLIRYIVKKRKVKKK